MRCVLTRSIAPQLTALDHLVAALEATGRRARSPPTPPRRGWRASSFCLPPETDALRRQHRRGANHERPARWCRRSSHTPPPRAAARSRFQARSNRSSPASPTTRRTAFRDDYGISVGRPRPADRRRPTTLLGLDDVPHRPARQESRAWTIESGTKAPQAAGKIHTDIERGFIRAEIIDYADYVRTARRKPSFRREDSQRGQGVRDARGRRR